jgi:serine/threonine protein kinase/Tol biopolymer transport system component
MGEVYRAKDPRLGREVALKVLPESLAADADRLRRFEQEARAASSLNHPNIVTIHEIGSANGTAFLAMELVDGASLRELLASGPMPPKRMLDVGVQIAEGLAKAHAAGIVHRDLKPENVMVSRDGYVKILDFGLAKLFVAPAGDETAAPTQAPQHTQPGSVMGTVGYMSPEQASGRPLDYRSDQFSLGSILYEMATGRRAFQRPTGAQTMAAIIQDEPESVAQVSPKTAPPFRWIVERCLAKDPDERYASTRDLARDLKSVREHLAEVTTSASGQSAVVESPRRRSRALPVVAAVAVIAALSGLYAGRRTAAVSQPTFQRLTFQRGTVSTARFGPDGSSVYYTAAWSGAPPRIFSLRPGNPESSALALPAAELLSISSAGEMAVLLEPNYTLTGFSLSGTLARVPLSGAAPKEVLANAKYAEWAPGGSELAVVHRSAGKDRLEYPIGKVLYETAGWIQNPRFSPDGRTLAFIDHSSAGDDGAIAMVDLAGKKTELAPGWATVQGLAWSPDGREIWFTAARDGIERMLYGVTPGGRLRLIRTMQGTPALLDVRKDGGALITEDDYRASVLAFRPTDPAGKDLTWFDWANDRALSADGKLMLFDESGEGGGAAGGVYLRPTDGAPAVRLGDGVGLALSPDSAWALTRTQTNSPNFVLVPVKVGQPKAFPPDGLGRTAYGFFVPDGSKFVFVANAPGKGSRLYVQEVAGGPPKAVSEEGISAARLFVSPDSRWIAAVGPDTRVHLYPLGGGPSTDLQASLPGDSPAGWTADGKGIYVSQTGIPCALDLIDIASGRRTHIRDLSGSDAGGVTTFGPVRVTPDGRTVTVGVVRILSTLYQMQGVK